MKFDLEKETRSFGNTLKVGLFIFLLAITVGLIFSLLGVEVGPIFDIDSETRQLMFKGFVIFLICGWGFIFIRNICIILRKKRANKKSEEEA